MPKDYIEIKLKTPIDISHESFNNCGYCFDKKLNNIKVSTRTSLKDEYIEGVMTDLAKDLLDKVKDKDDKVEYACNFSDPTICDTHCDTALFYYSFTEEVVGLYKIQHMELVLCNSEPTFEPIACLDLEAPLNFKYLSYQDSFQRNIKFSDNNVRVSDRYEIDDSYFIESFEDLSKNLLKELDKGDDKNIEYVCNFCTPVVYEKFCNKAVFNVTQIEELWDKTIVHLQLVLCNNNPKKTNYDDYVKKE